MFKEGYTQKLNLPDDMIHVFSDENLPRFVVDHLGGMSSVLTACRQSCEIELVLEKDEESGLTFFNWSYGEVRDITDGKHPTD